MITIWARTRLSDGIDSRPISSKKCPCLRIEVDVLRRQSERRRCEGPSRCSSQLPSLSGVRVNDVAHRGWGWLSSEQTRARHQHQLLYCTATLRHPCTRHPPAKHQPAPRKSIALLNTLPTSTLLRRNHHAMGLPYVIIPQPDCLDSNARQATRAQPSIKLG